MDPTSGEIVGFFLNWSLTGWLAAFPALAGLVRDLLCSPS